MIKGKSLMIRLEGSGHTIALATSCDLEMNSALSDVSTKDSNDRYQEQEVTGQSWTLTTANLLHEDGGVPDEGYNNLKGLCAAGTPVEAAFVFFDGAMGKGLDGTSWKGVSGVTPKVIAKGKAIITKLDLNAKNKENATMSATFTGKGALTFV